MAGFRSSAIAGTEAPRALSGSEPEPVPRDPPPPATPLPFFQYIWNVRNNAIAGFHADVYRQWIVERKHWKLHTFLVNDPAGIRRILVDNAENYVRGTIEPRIASARGDFTATVKSNGLRRTMSSVIHPRSMAGNAAIVLASTEELLERWDALPAHSMIEIYSEMARLMLDIMSRIAFSSDSSGMASVLAQTLARNDAKPFFHLLDFVPLIGRFAAAGRRHHDRLIFRRVHGAIDELIRKRSAKNVADCDDLLGRLIRERNPETGQPLDAQEIYTQLATFVSGGYQSVALSLSWTWYLLSLYPVEEARVHAELREVPDDRTCSAENPGRLTYTRMVVEESLRLYPVQHTLTWRGAIDDDEICGVRIPRGCTVTIAPWVLHRHEKLWDNPSRFDPGRFSPERRELRHRYAYLPFGAGPHVCIGASFVMMAVTLILSTVARRYHLRLFPDHAVEPCGLVGLRSQKGWKGVLEKR
jgi:cytochrome P450